MGNCSILYTRSGDVPVTKSWWLLRPFQSLPDVRTFRSVGNRLELAVLRRVPSRLRPHGVVAHRRLLSASTVRRLRADVAVVWAWGARDRADAEQLRSWGVDGLILDDLELIRELRVIGEDARGEGA